jgi:hypothetical protein
MLKISNNVEIADWEIDMTAIRALSLSATKYH